MVTTTTTLSHPAIGSVIGNADSEGVTQYLGLQYATLSDRFAPPRLKQYSQNDKVDATKNGPQTLSVPNGADHEFNLLQHSLDYDREAVRISDVDGLNLNVWVPEDNGKGPNHNGGKGLPVFAFIHGGGFHTGSANFPTHHLARFVRLSAAKGMPVIGVSLNYRVGAPGFMHSKEMAEAGYLPSNGFRDQQTALLWLQKYIGGFGGNPDDVTLMGESAGAVSTAVHLHSKQPLFKRAMLMSGSTLLMGPSPIEVGEANYAKAVKALGLDSLSPNERLEKLVSMDAQQLRATLVEQGVGPQVSMPLVDGDICPTSVDFKTVMDGSLDLPGKEWCDSLLLGDCAFDGSILGLPLGRKRSGIAQTFTTSIITSLPENIASKLLPSYSITPSTSDDEAFERVLQFGGDLSFYAPTIAFAQGLEASMPVYMYRFNEPNPWSGPWQGRCTHIHDLTFLLQNFNEFLGGEQRLLAEEFAGDVLAYVNGKEPWQRWAEEKRAGKVFEVGQRKGVREDVPGEVGRRSVVLDLAAEVGFDALRGAFRQFMTS